jgi:hypothetical protein
MFKIMILKLKSHLFLSYFWLKGRFDINYGSFYNLNFDMN